MRVKKTVDLDRDAINISIMYQNAMKDSPVMEDSTKWNNCTKAFAVMLQEIADKAFRLGQDAGRD